MPLIVMSVGVLLVVLLHNYFYKRLWDKGLSFDVNFSAKEAFEGDQMYLQEKLTNQKFLPLPWVFAKVPTSSNFDFIDVAGTEIFQGTHNSLFSIMMYTSIQRKKPFVCRRRGIYSIRYGEITVSNILHTKKYSKNLRINRELLVFPKPLYEFKDMSVFKQLDSAILTNRLINPDPFEFKGIRDYQPTDALKSINFKASAIAQKLMVNIQAPTADLRLSLVLNLADCGREVSLELYEQCIRLCAALAEHYVEMRASVSFATNGQDISTARPMQLSGGTSAGHLYKIFECLARISTGHLKDPMIEYVNNLTDREQVYIFISSYHKDDFVDAFRELEDRGISAFLIVPVFKDMDVTVSDSARIAVLDVTK